MKCPKCESHLITDDNSGIHECAKCHHKWLPNCAGNPMTPQTAAALRALVTELETEAQDYADRVPAPLISVQATLTRNIAKRLAAVLTHEGAETGDPERYFMDHGMIHDRKTGQHISTDEQTHPGGTNELFGRLRSYERMVHDYPKLSEFFSKHALGSMLAPSCFGCGDELQTRNGTTRHLELMDVFLCAKCATACKSAPAEPRAAEGAVALQSRVGDWMLACFGETIASDKVERNHRFLEEALELVQALGCTASEAHQLVDYVYGRPVGEPSQETGGVMVTLAALCRANGIDMQAAAETELARIWTKVEVIRAKQAAKPKHSPLPTAAAAVPAGGDAVAALVDAVEWFVCRRFAIQSKFDLHGPEDTAEAMKPAFTALLIAFDNARKLPAPRGAVTEALIERLVDSVRTWQGNIDDLRARFCSAINAITPAAQAQDATAYLVESVGSRHLCFALDDAQLFARDPSSTITPLTPAQARQ